MKAAYRKGCLMQLAALAFVILGTMLVFYGMKALVLGSPEWMPAYGQESGLSIDKWSVRLAKELALNISGMAFWILVITAHAVMFNLAERGYWKGMTKITYIIPAAVILVLFWGMVAGWSAWKIGNTTFPVQYTLPAMAYLIYLGDELSQVIKRNAKSINDCGEVSQPA